MPWTTETIWTICQPWGEGRQARVHHKARAPISSSGWYWHLMIFNKCECSEVTSGSFWGWRFEPLECATWWLACLGVKQSSSTFSKKQLRCALKQTNKNIMHHCSFLRCIHLLCFNFDLYGWPILSRETWSDFAYIFFISLRFYVTSEIRGLWKEHAKWVFLAWR